MRFVQSKYPQLASVDLRYDSEVVLKMAPGAADGAKGNGEAQSQVAKGASAAAAAPAKHAAAKKPVHTAKRSAARKRR